MTYHPDRLTQPIRRVGSRRDGQFEPITWDQALSELVSRLDTLATNGQVRSLAILTSGRPSHRQLLFDQFAARFGAPAPISYNLFDEPVVRRANDLSFGHDQLPTIDLARTRLLLSFGADFLGTWNSPVAQMAAYARMRRNPTGVRGSFVQIESRMTPTGASADEWLPVPPGTEGALALGLAHVILKEHLTSAPPGRAASLIDGWAAGLPDFTPEKVSAMTGVPSARIERLARALAGQRPAAAIIGGPALAHTNGLAAALAVNALNALLDSVDQPGGVCFTPRFRASDATRGGHLPSGGSAPTIRGTLQTLASEILSGRHPVEVLLVDGVNPVFAAPPAWRVGEALSRVPFVVSFGSFIDETAALADLILPDHTFLESWVDAVPESGSLVAVASVAPPTMTSLFQTRATPDVLLEVGRMLRQPIGLPWQTFEAMLKASFEALGPEVWSAAQKQGGWWEEPPAVPPTARPVSARLPAPTPSHRRVGRRSIVRATRVRCRRRRLSLPSAAIPVSVISRWIAGAPALASGAARSDDLRDVERLGRAASADGRAAAHPAGRSRASRIARRGGRSPRVRLAGYRAGRGRDARRPGSRDLHAVRLGARREPCFAARPDGRIGRRRAGLGGDPRQAHAGWAPRRPARPVFDRGRAAGTSVRRSGRSTVMVMWLPRGG